MNMARKKCATPVLRLLLRHTRDQLSYGTATTKRTMATDYPNLDLTMASARQPARQPASRPVDLSCGT